MPEIYLVTVFQKMELTNNFLNLGDRRCVGWFSEKEEAENAVENNFNNMNDGMYDYAVIEKMLSGIKIPETSRSFYKFQNGNYIKINTPKEATNYSNFGIG